jgi:hypothetical protein
MLHPLFIYPPHIYFYFDLIIYIAVLLLTYLGYLVVDLHWSWWVRSEDVVGQCCLRM